jgi:hypothetical protein
MTANTDPYPPADRGRRGWHDGLGRRVRWAVREAPPWQASQHLIFADDHDPRVRAPYVGGSPSRVLIDPSAGTETLALGRAYQPGRSAGDAWPAMGPVTRDCPHGAACPVTVEASCPEPFSEEAP